jgi:hypothetical protein
MAILHLLNYYFLGKTYFGKLRKNNVATKKKSTNKIVAKKRRRNKAKVGEEKNEDVVGEERNEVASLMVQVI